MIGYLTFLVPLLLIILTSLYFFWYKKKTTGRVHLLFLGGIFYILIGLPIMLSWYLYFALGFILFGFICIILSNFALLKKIPGPIHFLILILPILSISFLIWLEEPSKNIFLIPKGYTGRVFILFDCKEGKEKETEDGYTVFKIPQDGVLKVSFGFKGNSFDHLNSKFFYVYPDGKREELTQDQKVFAQGVWNSRELVTQKNPNKTESLDFIIDSRIKDIYKYRPEEREKFKNKLSCENN